MKFQIYFPKLFIVFFLENRFKIEKILSNITRGAESINVRNNQAELASGFKGENSPKLRKSLFLKIQRRGVVQRGIAHK